MNENRQSNDKELVDKDKGKEIDGNNDKDNEKNEDNQEDKSKSPNTITKRIKEEYVIDEVTKENIIDQIVHANKSHHLEFSSLFKKGLLRITICLAIIW
eukprot:CAMPEP_0170521240 /NCGR_PEP_ID=MMETSP0209-20121228/6551_1 /TAXON_ID=665100 ORGANISM="Litonotus pictus, Strain P1" /NCGR_SAMPLE_ID=MMETSP0209 /ASSEMBLY_ACC=CAM_ASM_000301 /LENGTH=98 /DNA_ID=CAMNT_0010807969 /DNA_START=655 /DNA_END=948 /DNA_ORIENTATION=-